MIAGPLIYAILSADAICGGSVWEGNTEDGCRIFPLLVPISLDQIPLIGYEGDDENQTPTLTGQSSLVKQTIRIACIAGDPDTASALAQSAKVAMRNAQPGTYGGIIFSRAFHRGYSEQELPLPGAGEDVVTYISTIEMEIWFTPPTG